MSKADAVRDLAEPMVSAAGADLYDVTLNGGKLVVSVTRSGGIDLEALTAISRELNRALDDVDLIGGSYTLEVSSPGLERVLRTPSHFADAVGETITVRTTGTSGARRVRGRLDAADPDGFSVVIDEADGTNAVGDTVTVAYDRVQSARTVFVWGEAADARSTSKRKK